MSKKLTRREFEKRAGSRDVEDLLAERGVVVSCAAEDRPGSGSLPLGTPGLPSVDNDRRLAQGWKRVPYWLRRFPPLRLGRAGQE